MILSFGRHTISSLLLLAACLPASQAFTVPSANRHAAVTTTPLWSTPPGPTGGDQSSGNLDDDEISKLIGKRSQIRRKKKELPEEDKMPDDLMSFDLESLPEFKTARPVRKSQEEQDAEEAAEELAARKDDDIVLSVDFLSDYDDENDFHIPNRIGFSTIGWGDPTRGFVAEGKLTKRMIKAGKYVPGDCQMVYNKLMEGGISFIETSSAYGKASRGQSKGAHEILAQSVAEYQADGATPSVLESLPFGWLPRRPSSMRAHAEKSCERLTIDTVDIVQATKRIPLLSGLLANGLFQVQEAGSTNNIGVAGIVQRSSLRRFSDSVENQGSTLTSNAFEFSLTNVKNEAMIDYCKDMGIIPLIYNPLDGGLASGVYTATNPSGGEVGNSKFKFEQLEKLQPLHSVQETVAERARTRVKREQRDMKDRFRSRYGPVPKVNTDITTTQVAINYVVAKGGVPLPEINTPAQADELLGCLGWGLTEDEVDMLDNAAALCNL